MSLEQIENAILGMSPPERRRLLAWMDENREDLFDEEQAGPNLSPAQTAELLHRRQEYAERPENFSRMDKPALDAMFARIRRHVAARLSPAR